MFLRKRESKPRVGDPVWVASRFADVKNHQPNGYIIRILWDDDEIVCQFHVDKWHPKREQETYSLETFLGPCWSDSFGYIIEDSTSAAEAREHLEELIRNTGPVIWMKHA